MIFSARVEQNKAENMGFREGQYGFLLNDHEEITQVYIEDIYGNGSMKLRHVNPDGSTLSPLIILHSNQINRLVSNYAANAMSEIGYNINRAGDYLVISRSRSVSQMYIEEKYRNGALKLRYVQPDGRLHQSHITLMPEDIKLASLNYAANAMVRKHFQNSRIAHV